MRFSSPLTRLGLGFVTVLLGASVVLEVGCTHEEAAPEGTAVFSGPVEGTDTQASATVGRYAKETGAGEGAASTLANTVGLLPGTTTAGAHTALDQLFGGAAPQAGAWPTTYSGLCPPDMASIDDRFCVDRYEASLLEVMPNGSERPFSPYESVKGHVVRAVSEAGVYPQGYISEVQAIQACSLSGKRLCKAKEWRQACMGPEHKTYGYANKSAPGKCNDHGRSPMAALYANESLASRDKWGWDRMNRPELNQFEGTLAHTGDHDECTNGYGVYDMVGNLHEWVDDPNGTFQGGYYQDTTLNGEGCQYVTTAHEARYHDYSTGFRCCSDVSP